MSEASLITPYGGEAVNLVAQGADAARLWEAALRLPSIQLSDRAVCDLEMMATGGLSPIKRYMDRDDFTSVVADMRLADGTLYPIPVTLPVDPDAAPSLDSRVALRDSQNNLLAVMDVEDAYEWDYEDTVRRVFGTEDMRHPLVAEMRGWGRCNLSGRISVLALPPHHDFRKLRMTPAQTRKALERLGKPNVVAFQTRNPLHRVHEELTRRAAEGVGGALLLHPVVGLTQPGDVDHYTRVRTYTALADNYYDRDSTVLALLPLAMRMAGPREALWHAIIRRNYGASHLIVGRDHAGPGLDSQGAPFYGPDDAQRLLAEYADEIGVAPIGFGEFVYVPSEDRYEERSRLANGVEIASISGTQVRRDYLNAGKLLPDWFTRPEVAEILAESYPPSYRQGVCVWFTGLSGAGKSTTAVELTNLLMERGRRVTVLDGDVVRTNLSKGLGFSREDRDANIQRIGFVAAEVVRHGGVAVCAAISPYQAARDAVRGMVGAGQFIEVFVDTPLEVCERRDSKGMYARARAGEIVGFTGIDDPYEVPPNPEITLDTVLSSAEDNAAKIIDRLVSDGYLRSDG